MIAALLLILGMTASAVFADGSGDTFFYDDAGILTQTELDAVNARLQEISDAQQCGVYVKTTDDFNGKTPNEYADDFYDMIYYKHEEYLVSVKSWHIEVNHGYSLQ